MSRRAAPAQVRRVAAPVHRCCATVACVAALATRLRRARRAGGFGLRAEDTDPAEVQAPGRQAPRAALLARAPREHAAAFGCSAMVRSWDRRMDARCGCAVEPGRQYLFSVRPVNASGSVVRLRGRAEPVAAVVSAVQGAARVGEAGAQAARHAQLGEGAGAVDGRLAGYRVYRDGVVYRQVKPRRRSIPVRVTPGTHVFRVIAADTRGAMGLPSRSVRVRVRHSAPTVPGRLRVGRVTDATVELGWGTSRKRSSPIAGYRIFRNGVPIGQVTGLTTDGRQPRPRDGVPVLGRRRRQMGLSGPPRRRLRRRPRCHRRRGASLHAFLLATTDESFRDLQRHYQQIGTVYPTYFDCRRGDGGDHRQGRPARHALGADAAHRRDAALQLPARADAQHDPAQSGGAGGDADQPRRPRTAARIRRHQPGLRGRLRDRSRRAHELRRRARPAAACARQAS